MLRPLSGSLLVVAVVALFSSVVASAPEETEHTSLGSAQCDGWTSARSSGTRGSTASAMTAWVLGYLSGLNSIASKDALKGLQTATVEAAMDRYCKSHPQNDIGNGAMAIFDVLYK
jgi:hypothetical protein